MIYHVNETALSKQLSNPTSGKICQKLHKTLVYVAIILQPYSFSQDHCLLCWGLTTRQPLRVILCRLPEKRRKEIEERVEEMKERDREERGTGMKVKKQKK